MMKRISRIWHGSYPPWTIAGAFAALAIICVIGFPPGATASHPGGQQTIGMNVDDGVPPDIVASRIEQQVYIDDSTLDDAIDTSQYTLATTTAMRATGVCEATTCLTGYGGSGAGVETPTHIAAATTRHVSDAPIVQ